MKILFIAPVPPPITGQSLISDCIFKEYKTKNLVSLVNLSKAELKSGFFSFSRFFDFFLIFFKILKVNKKSDVVYLTIAESVLGNLKDLIIYLLLGKNIRNTIIHVHGGSFKSHVLDKSNLISKLNTYFFKKINKIIVLGDSHKLMFNQKLLGNKIFTLPNFVPSNLFIAPESIETKFNIESKIKFLYLSNLMKGKGYDVLIEAFEKMDCLLSSNIELHFAGSFAEDESKLFFLNKIKKFNNVFYHGVVQSKEKKKLLESSCVLVLPSSFLEGQPLCILEAYANACSVITTTPPGVKDIFVNDHNGLGIKVNDSEDLKIKMEFLIQNRILIRKHGLINYQDAKDKYTYDIFIKNFNNLIKIRN